MIKQQDTTRIEQLETEIRKLRTEAAIKEGKEINQRRAEVVQLVAAIVMNKAIKWTDKDMWEAVSTAIKFQAEIAQQLNGKDWSKPCPCGEASTGETWCCNNCGLPKVGHCTTKLKLKN